MKHVDHTEHCRGFTGTRAAGKYHTIGKSRSNDRLTLLLCEIDSANTFYFSCQLFNFSTFRYEAVQGCFRYQLQMLRKQVFRQIKIGVINPFFISHHYAMIF